MKLNDAHTPVFKQFVKLCRAGFKALEKNIQNDIRSFVLRQQNDEGVFVDRAGKSDLYYSLFGLWMLNAMESNAPLKHFENYIRGQKTEGQKGIDEYVLKLIQTQLFPDNPPKPVWRNRIKQDSQINFSYRFFIQMLILDARYSNNYWLRMIFKFFLRFYRINSGAPCSMVAALMVTKHKVGLPTKQLKNLLFEHYQDFGFVSFKEVKTPDMLSTAVALFALWYTHVDLRLIAPACLNFIEENYRNGAFISGDGDETKDIEYTFYGLLALGTLSNIN